MNANPGKLSVYLEVGKKKVFAAAVHSPGWCRFGKDEASALQALAAAGPRYAAALALSGLDFQPPSSAEDFVVVERLPGNATTDFGAPDAQPAADRTEFDQAAFEFCRSVLEACWGAFDQALASAAGKHLARGPRGGRREQDAILRHLIESDASYLSQVGWRVKLAQNAPAKDALVQIRTAALAALAAGVRGELESSGPRGGKRWPPRTLVRRMAWHTLDHAWEIEDRIMPVE